MEEDKKTKILLVGDVSVVEYMYGSLSGINKNNGSIEIDRGSSEIRCGGIINIAHSLISKGIKCDIFSVCGNDTSFKIIQEELISISIDPKNIISLDGEKTDISTRINSGGKEICDIRSFSKNHIDDKILVDKLSSIIENFDYIFIQESLNMTTGGNCIPYIIKTAGILGIPVYLDSMGTRGNKYIGINSIFLDLDGFKRFASLDPNIDPEKDEIEKICSSILMEYGIGEIVIYLGSYGSFRMDMDKKLIYSPGYDNIIIDNTGARNSFVSTYFCSVISGGSPEGSMEISNISSSITSKYIGEFTPTMQEIIEFLEKINEKN